MSDLFPFFDEPDTAAIEPELDVPRRDTMPRAESVVRERPSASPKKSITVSELSAEIRSVLEGEIGERVVEGEVSNSRLWNTGHLYFTLKDAGAQIRAVMFRSVVRQLKFKPEDGLHVVARGRVSVYEPKGEYQLVCDQMEPRGLGALQLAFEQVKKRLQAEGLFDAVRKRPLPSLPRKIGVVTSLDGAAVRDILKVLARRYPHAHIVIRPSRVQGDEAAADLVRSMQMIGKVPGVDVVIVGRGGGSIEDLWAFNDERLARAIAACPVPVISAVGHEVDFTIADFVADLRAPTPSAAAEMVVSRREELCSRIDRHADRLRDVARAALDRRRASVHRLTSARGLASFPARLAMRSRHVSELTHTLARTARASLQRRDRQQHALRQRLDALAPGRRMQALLMAVSSATERLLAAAERTRHRHDAGFRALAGRLENLSPLGVLARGYALCWDDERTCLVRESTAVAPGDRVRVTLAKGEIGCVVDRTSES
ncbi:MAG: exodeoxyribonuclease VII large subunit [Vicinamibacterales bacterium]